MYFMSLTKNIVLVMKVYTHIPNGTDYIEGIASPRDYFIEQTREINCVMSCAKQENDETQFYLHRVADRESQHITITITISYISFFK